MYETKNQIKCNECATTLHLEPSQQGSYSCFCGKVKIQNGVVVEGQSLVSDASTAYLKGNVNQSAGSLNG
jgi:hypothetical protein